MRRRPDAPNGLTEFLVVEALEWARDTGASELSLNFCALTDFLAPERVTTPLRRLVRRGLLLADNVFQLERLYAFNRKFFPEWRRRYICVERFSDLPAVGLARGPVVARPAAAPRPDIGPHRGLACCG
jgi:lysyl-tRNA synthetase class 2